MSEPQSLTTTVCNSSPSSPAHERDNTLAVMAAMEEGTKHGSTPHSASEVDQLAAETKKNKEQFKGLAEQFNMLVMISTFTAALVVSFLSFARDIMDENRRRDLEIGMLLSFFSIGLHIATIIVAGRSAALGFQQSANSDQHGYKDDTDPVPMLAESRKALKRFQDLLYLCEHLQLLATILFLASILFIIYFIFSNIAYPIVFFVATLGAAYWVYGTGYWEVSVAARDLRKMMGTTQIQRALERCKRKRSSTVSLSSQCPA